MQSSQKYTLIKWICRKDSLHYIELTVSTTCWAGMVWRLASMAWWQKWWLQMNWLISKSTEWAIVQNWQPTCERRRLVFVNKTPHYNSVAQTRWQKPQMVCLGVFFFCQSFGHQFSTAFIAIIVTEKTREKDKNKHLYKINLFTCWKKKCFTGACLSHLNLVNACYMLTIAWSHFIYNSTLTSVPTTSQYAHMWESRLGCCREACFIYAAPGLRWLAQCCCHGYTR